jgi:hypothetical protein
LPGLPLVGAAREADPRGHGLSADPGHLQRRAARHAAGTRLLAHHRDHDQPDQPEEEAEHEPDPRWAEPLLRHRGSDRADAGEQQQPDHEDLTTWLGRLRALAEDIDERAEQHRHHLLIP